MTERAALPDLDQLNPTELKALIISQHELITSRDSEIEQLKLLTLAEGRSLPGLWRSTAQVGRRCVGDHGTGSGALLRDPAGAGEVGLWELRQDRASASTEPADRARNGWTRATGACAGLEVRGSPSLVPAGRDFRARRSGTGSRDVGGLGSGNQPTDGAISRWVATTRNESREAACGRCAGSGIGARARQNQDGAAVDVCAR